MPDIVVVCSKKEFGVITEEEFEAISAAATEEDEVFMVCKEPVVSSIQMCLCYLVWTLDNRLFY